MKVKLLKKVRRRTKLYKRNNEYRVYSGQFTNYRYCSEKKEAESFYRFYLIYDARQLFGVKHKKRLHI